MTGYEDLIGPLDPGYVTAPRGELQKALRALSKQRELDSCWIDFCVCHALMNGSEISDALELEPDTHVAIDDTVYESEQHLVMSNITIWTLSSRGRIATNRFESHLLWVLDKLFGKLPKIRMLQGQGADLKLTVHLTPSRPEVLLFPALDVEAISRLAQLRVPLEFIIVREVEDDDE